MRNEMSLKLLKTDLIAFDPGETTGVVEIKQGKLIKAYTIKHEELLKGVAFGDALIKQWQQYKLWVIEDFRIYPWAVVAGFDPALAARLIGALQVAALQSNAQIVFQLAGTVKQFVNNDKLKLLGWWPLLRNDHARDAARHAAYYLITNVLYVAEGKGGVCRRCLN